MRQWSIGTNDYYYTGSIWLEEAPWYIFALGSFIQWICYFFPRIPLPKIKIIREGEETNLKDWYGTTGDLFHCFICDPIFGWCWGKIKSTYIEFPYLKLKEEFPEMFKDENNIWDDQSEEEKLVREKNSEYSKKVGEEFNIYYKKLQNISENRMKETD